jgi:hypothetical protein
MVSCTYGVNAIIERRVHSHEQMNCVAAQRLAGYANYANPPYIELYSPLRTVSNTCQAPSFT